MKNVIVYSTPTCTYCKAAKEYMQAHGIQYVEHNVASDIERRTEMVNKSGQLGVPVFDVEGKIIVGYEESELAEAVGVK